MASKKKSLEQFVAGLELETRSVPLELIDYQADNPNEIPPDVYEQLKADIRDNGFWQPVLLTPVGNRFKMVDGEHRARIVTELGGTTIPAVIADEWETDEAMLRLITMNRYRGDFVPLRLGERLADLAERRPEAELRQRLGMDDAAMRGLIELARFTDDPGERLAEEIERERQEAPRVLRFVVAQRDGEVIDRVVESAAAGKMDRGKALAAVCREWERTHKTKSKEAA